MAVLDFHFPGRKRKVVKCSYKVVLVIVSQWRSTFHLFITSSLFPSYLSQSSIFKIPHLLMGAGEADGRRSLCVNKRVARWMCSSSRSFASQRVELPPSQCTAWTLIASAFVGSTKVSGSAPQCRREDQTILSAKEWLYWENTGMSSLFLLDLLLACIPVLSLRKR